MVLYETGSSAYTFRMARQRITRLLTLSAVFGMIGLLSSCASTYIGRYFAWGTIGGPEMQDKFPTREISAAPSVFPFREDPVRAGEYAQLFLQIEYRNAEKEPVRKPFPAFLEDTATHAFVVILDDTIIYENYAKGFSRESNIASFSMSKSVTSALIGIALDEGLIGSVNDPISKYLPEYSGKNFSGITIENLLAMNAGFKNSLGFAPWNNFVRSYFDPDLRKVALNQKYKYPPGEHFSYNNSNTQLLGIILERVTGMSPSKYLEEKIWTKIGTAGKAHWSLDSEKHGFEQMASGLYARPLDYARFGRLFLTGGSWEREQIISRQWVQESTTRDASRGDPVEYFQLKNKDDSFYDFFINSSGYYAYQWWGYEKSRGVPNDFYASGMFGQYIYVCPEKNALILRFGNDAGEVYSWPEILKRFADRL